MKLAPLAPLALLLPLLAACERQLSGPPVLKLGRDECIECGMMLADEVAACAMIHEGEYLLFDDVGCIIERFGAIPATDAFVHDRASKKWIDAASAHYLCAHPERLKTPMGTGIVAFASRSDAEDAQARFGGKIVSAPEVPAARWRWDSEPMQTPANASLDRRPDR